MVGEGQGPCPPQPTPLLAFSCAVLQITFLPKPASLPVCMPLAPVVLPREVSWVGDVLQFSASSLSLACVGSPGLRWGPESPRKALSVRQGIRGGAAFPRVHFLVSLFPGRSS